jgi:hypothetical protein
MIQKKREMGEFVPTPGKKFKTKIGESFSNWREDLVEVIDKEEQDKQIKEKNVKNKVVIDPELKLESVADDLGATLIEMVELDEFDFIVEGVYDELLEEGYDEDLIEDAIEYALTEAKVTMGHDTDAPKRERTRDRLKKSAKSFIGKMAYKGYHAARKAKRAAEPAVQRAKTSAKRGIRKAALKVADRLKEENVDEAVYGGTPEKKKDTRMTVTAADKKGNTLAYQKYKAGDKRYKAADHMGEETEVQEKLNLKKSDMGTVVKDFYKSDAPQFKGKSKEKRREMAVAAKLTAERGGKKLGEETIDERTRYAKETGKDPQTGKPSVKGGEGRSEAGKHMQKYMRQTGGAMSSRGKAIAVPGKKKVKGAKPKFKTGPTPVDKIKGMLAKKRAPKPDIGSRFD